MKAMIFCEPTEKGVHTFYLELDGSKYFLFRQNYRKGVQKYFGRGVRLDQSRDFSKSGYDSAIIKTMEKIPSHIKYLEKEYGILVYEQSKKKLGRSQRLREVLCA